MSTTMKCIAAIPALFFLLSFTVPVPEDFTGKYGVADADPSRIELIINADQTFYYQDFSDPANKIIARGRWEQKKKKVILIPENPVGKFHNVWVFDNNQCQVAKSRKGLSFYRLIKMQE